MFQKEKPHSQKTTMISVLIFMAVHYVSGVLVVLQGKNKSGWRAAITEEKVCWTLVGKIYFTIRFIKANCSLLHFYPLLKDHEIFSSQRGWRIKIVLEEENNYLLQVWCFKMSVIINPVEKYRMTFNRTRQCFTHWNCESSLQKEQ